MACRHMAGTPLLGGRARDTWQNIEDTLEEIYSAYDIGKAIVEGTIETDTTSTQVLASAHGNVQ